jgi:hypothetical protein
MPQHVVPEHPLQYRTVTTPAPSLCVATPRPRGMTTKIQMTVSKDNVKVYMALERGHLVRGQVTRETN